MSDFSGFSQRFWEYFNRYLLLVLGIFLCFGESILLGFGAVSMKKMIDTKIL